MHRLLGFAGSAPTYILLLVPLRYRLLSAQSYCINSKDEWLNETISVLLYFIFCGINHPCRVIVFPQATFDGSMSGSNTVNTLDLASDAYPSGYNMTYLNGYY